MVGEKKVHTGRTVFCYHFIAKCCKPPPSEMQEADGFQLPLPRFSGRLVTSAFQIEERE